MSFIPFNAISGAQSSVQHTTNDLIRPRQIQNQKNFHHTEEVEELDDTAVNTVDEQQKRDGRGKNPEKHEEHDLPTEKIDIEALSDIPPAHPHDSSASVSNLDISA